MVATPSYSILIQAGDLSPVIGEIFPKPSVYRHQVFKEIFPACQAIVL
jgi:hypothetical protein